VRGAPCGVFRAARHKEGALPDWRNGMKAICPRDGLLSAVQLVSAAIPSREIKPILRNIKAIADPDRCTLMATDLEIGIRLDVMGMSVQEPGEAILPAQRLLSILREARDDELTVEADSTSCTVRGDAMEFEMPGEDPALFPDLPTFNEDKYHEVAPDLLREMIRRTVFAAAEGEGARYAMTGVLWDLEDDHIRLVATDGRRLALTEGKAKAHGGHTTRGQTPLVPAKAMALLERNLQPDGQPVRVCLRPNEALFRTETAVIYSRLVEGRFPDFRAVFPKKPAVRIPLQVGPFHAAVRQAAIMTDQETRRVTFKFSTDKLTLQAQGAGAGRSKVQLPITYDGKAVDINFNPAFLVDMLKVLPEDAELTLDLIDGGTPALFRSGPAYAYLVMPLT
jgi:DNA polymerase III subunit beta